MDRHRTDFVALLFGFVFLAVGGGFIAHEASGRSLDPVWVIAVTCSTIGSAFLAVTLVNRRARSEQDEPGAAP